MLRRDPDAVINAHILDPERRELFVEGKRDRVFLLWVVGSDRDPNARIAEIDEVDLPAVSQGGQRARLLSFAADIVHEPARIRFLADADTARFVDEPIPENVWLTDLRDLEGYVFRVECVGKALMLGAGVDVVDAGDLVATITRLARRLAALRALSVRGGLDLPMQRLELARYVVVVGGVVDVDFDRVLRTLMQNAGLSLTQFDDLKTRWEDEEESLAGIPDGQLVHGRDVICLVGEVLCDHGVSRADAPKIVWTSFERRLIEDYPTLSEVVDFLSVA